MTLQTIAVTQPAAGHDWTYTVPGQWTIDLSSISARLVSATNPTTASDSSPNGNNATYNAAHPVTFGVTGPFGGGGGQAVRDLNINQAGANIATFANGGGALDTATFTAEALVKGNATGSVFSEIVAGRDTSGSPGTVRWMLGCQPGFPYSLRAAASNADVFSLLTTFTANAWHHVAVTYDGAQWVGYVDGVASLAVAGHLPTLTTTNKPFGIGGDTLSAQSFQGDMAAAAVFGSALSGAQIAAHYAAVATSAAAYKTAVLTDSPLALWMLDEQVTHYQRTVILEITDGTNVVASFPGFTPTQQSSVFSWTWLVDGQATVQSVDQSTTVVSIPRLVLPAGYVIRSRTVDLAAADQWSNVTIWWDDTYQQSAAGTDPFVYPPGAYLNIIPQGG